ncbi:MAG TPA: hypothetical protein VE912_13005 [Bacteroidales bacterium]|nr:hypothetical protein [Bacteroidales bacterium]
MRKRTRKFLMGISIIVLAGLIYPTNVKAQSPYELGTQVASAGIGLGWSYSYYGSTNSFPAISLSYDYNIYELEDVGMISIGGTFGYKRVSYDYPSTSYKASWTTMVFGARGALHVDIFDNENLDTYGGLVLGIRSVRYKDTYYDQYGTNPYSYGGAHVMLAGFIGTRYYFNPNLAVYGELGYGIAILNLGVSLEL